jgi:hypothetical protein
MEKEDKNRAGRLSGVKTDRIKPAIKNQLPPAMHRLVCLPAPLAWPAIHSRIPNAPPAPIAYGEVGKAETV